MVTPTNLAVLSLAVSLGTLLLRPVLSWVPRLLVTVLVAGGIAWYGVQAHAEGVDPWSPSGVTTVVHRDLGPQANALIQRVETWVGGQQGSPTGQSDPTATPTP